eukprot:462249-Rhodomonas_salina.1
MSALDFENGFQERCRVRLAPRGLCSRFLRLASASSSLKLCLFAGPPQSSSRPHRNSVRLPTRHRTGRHKGAFRGNSYTPSRGVSNYSTCPETVQRPLLDPPHNVGPYPLMSG